ncbi:MULTISPECIES: hypothetical protein [Helcococcus]|uniref:Uncharacterized protein n=1 Tax=Helcococcus bovis TaxID=3153252 RepID=A0ABW9F744_9FIRM
MKKYYIDINQYEFLIDKFPEILNKFSGKTLILSLIQEDRSLEKKLKISDEIIFDNSDYINSTVGFAKAVMEIDDEIEILPSSYKMKETSVDFNRFIEELENEEYENIIVLFDNKLDIQNKPELSKKDELMEIFEGIYIFEDEENIDENLENNKDIDDLAEKENKAETERDINKEDVKKISIFEKIKRLFKKNG